MQSPIALVALLRPSTRGDLLAASASASLVFTATPFLLPAVSDEYGVAIGTASLISSAQLSGFVLASSLGGRLVAPSRRLLVAVLVIAAATQALSALSPWFWGLMALRFASGSALGVITWLGWQEVFGDNERMGDLAVVGPVVGIVGAPIAALMTDAGGTNLTFATLAVAAATPLLLTARSGELHAATLPRRHHRSTPVPIARVILALLSLVTLGGSSVFVFVAAIGTDRLGMEPLMVSLAVSANALLGIPSARYRGPRRWSGAWLVVTGSAALTATTVEEPMIFAIALAVWGFAFWAAIPGAFTLLAERSAHPADRAGDAQSVMAAGRVLGPILGGLLVEAGSYTTLGIVAGSLIGTAGLGLLVVERQPRP